jgi:hypothetical protein
MEWTEQTVHRLVGEVVPTKPGESFEPFEVVVYLRNGLWTVEAVAKDTMRPADLGNMNLTDRAKFARYTFVGHSKAEDAKRDAEELVKSLG